MLAKANKSQLLVQIKNVQGGRVGFRIGDWEWKWREAKQRSAASLNLQ